MLKMPQKQRYSGKAPAKSDALLMWMMMDEDKSKKLVHVICLESKGTTRENRGYVSMWKFSLITRLKSLLGIPSSTRRSERRRTASFPHMDLNEEEISWASSAFTQIAALGSTDTYLAVAIESLECTLKRIEIFDIADKDVSIMEIEFMIQRLREIRKMEARITPSP